MKKLISIFSIILLQVILLVSESYATISFVQGKSLYTGNSLSFTSNVTAGNLIVVVAQYATSDPSATASDNNGNSYTLIAKSTPPTANTYTYMWYAKNIKAGATIVTVTSGRDNGMSILEFSGADSTLPLDVFGSRSSSTSTNHPTIDLTTTHDGDLIVAVFGNELNVGAAISDNGWTEATGEASQWHETIYKITTTTGLYTAGTTQNSAVQAGVAAAFTVAGTQGSGGGGGGGGSTYYVSPSGSASWPNCYNINTPCSAMVAVANAVAGDIVYFRGGTYLLSRIDGSRFTPVLNPANSGTAGNPITLINYPGESPIITYAPGVTGSGPLIGAHVRNYIIWDGFIIQEVAANNAQDTGPVVFFGNNRGDTDHNIIRNCDIRAVEVTLNPYSENHNAIRVEESTNLTIENNKIHGIQGSFWNQSGITIYFSDHITIQHNEIYDNYTGVYTKGGDNTDVIIRYNIIHDGAIGVRRSFTYNSKVYQNIIYNMTSYGVIVAETTGTCTNAAADFHVYNNTIYNVPQGIIMPGLPDRATGANNIFLNNIISNTTYPLALGSGCETNFQGDFSADYGDYFNYTAYRQGGTDRNFADWKANTGWDAHSITSDPRFVNAAAHDFHLQAGSPAINAGIDFGDLNNNGSTTDPITQGAYVTGSEIIGIQGNMTFDRIPPASPMGLIVQ